MCASRCTLIRGRDSMSLRNAHMCVHVHALLHLRDFSFRVPHSLSQSQKPYIYTRPVQRFSEDISTQAGDSKNIPRYHGTLHSTYPIHERPRPPLSLVFRCFFCDGCISSASCPRVVTLQTPRPTASTSSTGCSRSAELDTRSSSSRAPKHVSLYSRPCLPFACKRNGCVDPPARAAAGLSRRRHQVPASAPG